MALDEEYFLLHTSVGVDAEKGLPGSDKVRPMKDGVRRQLPELNAVGKKRRQLRNSWVVRDSSRYKKAGNMVVTPAGGLGRES
jgi:hypothetical protein